MDVHMVRMMSDGCIYFVGTLKQCRHYLNDSTTEKGGWTFEIVKAKFGTQYDKWEVVEVFTPLCK